MTYRSPSELQSEAKKLLDEKLPQKDELKAKQRIAIPSQDMPSQAPEVRIGNLDEVAVGYSEDQARLEALRCTQCKKRPCIMGCPVRIDIPGFIQHIADGEFQSAIDVIKESSLLPAICGRVCPQEVQCQAPCTVSKSLKDVQKGVSIGRRTSPRRCRNPRTRR